MRSYTIHFGDKPKELRYGSNAIRQVEEQSKMGSIVKMLSEDNVGYNSIMWLLWGGLKHDNRKLTMDDVGELMDAYLEDRPLSDLIEEVLEALNACNVFGKPKPPDEDDLGN